MSAARNDPLLAVAIEIERWLLKTCDYGEESANYLNGDSEVFHGDAWEHAEKLKRNLRKALAGRGVDLKQQLHAITKKRR